MIQIPNMSINITILDQYIGKSLAYGFLIIITVLVSFFTFLDFVEELKHVGTGLYTTLDAFLTVILMTLGRTLPLAPTAALLGCLYGLGKLRQSSEIIAMTASGLSATHMARSAMKTGILLIIFITLGLQFVTPELARIAWQHRTMAISGSLGLHTNQASGVWFRNQSTFINVKEMTYGNIPTELEIFEFNTQGELIKFTYAEEANLQNNGKWLLKEVTQSVITDGNITSQNYPTLSWGTFLVPKKIMLLTMAPENLSLTDLYNYAKDLKSRGENPDQYVLVFWQKISIPLTAAGMILISIPFLLGSQRSTSVGHNMMIGVVVGVGFYLGAQIISHIGVLLEWNPALTALTPALILITLATGILRKTH